MDNLLEELLEEYDVVLRGHFLLASGKHSDTYIEKANLYKHPHIVSDLCYDIAIRMAGLYGVGIFEPMIDVVVGPEHGGIILSHRVAERLTEIYGEPVTPLFTQEDERGNSLDIARGKQVFRRAYRNEVAGKNVLVVDDVLTTGGTVRNLAEYIKGLGGNVLAVAVICNRGDVKPEDLGGVPLYSLLDLKLESWPAEDCPLCSQGVPLTDK